MKKSYMLYRACVLIVLLAFFRTPSVQGQDIVNLVLNGKEPVSAQPQPAPGSGLTVEFERDPDGRPLRLRYSNGLTLSYEYDAVGNRLKSASSMLLFTQQGVKWQGKAVNLVLKSGQETDAQTIERLKSTTGKLYKPAPAGALDFLLLGYNTKDVVPRYVSSIKDWPTIVILNAIAVEEVSDKIAGKK